MIKAVKRLFAIEEIVDCMDEAFGSSSGQIVCDILTDYVTRHQAQGEETAEVPTSAPVVKATAAKVAPVTKPKKAPAKKSKKADAPPVVSDDGEEVVAVEKPKRKAKAPAKAKVAVVDVEEYVDEDGDEAPSDITPITEVALDKMTILMLKDKCKEFSIRPVGNKQSLIDKIKAHLAVVEDEEEDPEEGPSHDADDIEIVQDENNLYIHQSTGLIFDPNARVAVAWKDEDANILPLTREHIELCSQYGFEYRIDED
ncbi:unnamed protein product [Boreogadus saida]